MSLPFVHLHCHSHYSLLDGASRIPELVARVKQLGMNAVALTDHGNLYGAIELYQECLAAGIKPIIGYEAYVAPGKRSEREARGMSEASYHLTLLARNRTGLHNLIQMASLAFLEGFYYRPRIDKELLEAHHEGIICLSGCASSEFNQLILKDRLDEAADLARWFARIFGPRQFFIEIQNNGLDFQKACTEGALEISRRLGIEPVATSDAHYLCQADADAHDVLLCINTGKLRSDHNRLRYGSNQFYVREPAEMYQLFPDHADAVRRSQEIADGIDLQLDFKRRHFPAFEPPAGKKADEYLRELCLSGLIERYGNPPPPAAVERLEHELSIINRLGFAGYFLIVWDFVRFAREQGIPAAARGSACGAIVSYVLRLSPVDPLEYDLLFERFLDPNRAEAPDIDIDFCQERREEVLSYVRRKYGESSVAQIATFGTMAARAAIRDVGRALGVELPRVDQIAKMIPQQLGITLDDALRQSPDLRRQYEADPAIKEMIDIARKLEGTNRNVSTHAAGVVIADGPITNYVPVQRVASRADDDPERRQEAALTTQWTMEDLEKVGMLKMDFLGLRTLTLLDKAVKLIRHTRKLQIELDRLPLDDPKTYALLQRGDAQGVFQFESAGIRDLLQRMKPDNIRDLIACTALYRPGPLGGGMVDAYINRKHGVEKPVYAHPVMEEILAETYGVMVYQEQVMQILNRLGGIELSSAYACIKAISKKKHEIIDQRRAEFIEGAKQRGVSEAVAADIFGQITHFGGYGFNKSHSAAYALISFQTAYLKTHFPAEFLAAVLTSEIGNSDKIAEHVDDARKLSIEIVPPDVNRGDAEFTVQEGKVIFGLSAIRGFGRKAAEAVVAERQAGGPYHDIFNFCARIEQGLLNRSAVEALVKAGAFDSLHPCRAAVFAAVPSALQAGSTLQEDRRHGQMNFFDALGSDVAPVHRLPDVPEWPDAERLSYEKEALGFFISSHPLARYQDELRRYTTHSIEQLPTLAAQQEVIVGGMLAGVRFTTAKRSSRSGNTRMARFLIEDFTGSIECVIFPDAYLQSKDLVANDRVCLARAAVDRSREEVGLIVHRLMTIEQAQKELTRGLALRLVCGVHGDELVPVIGRLLQQTPGRCPVFMEVLDPAGKRAWLRLGDEFSVDVVQLSTSHLEELLGAGHVRLLGNGNGFANGSY